MSIVDELVQRPLLLNLLAQQGYSRTPQSPFAAIGRAGLATRQQEQEGQMSELQKQLIQSQIGLNRSKISQGANPGAGNVQSVQKGANGNFIVFTRGSAEPIDTGVKFDKNVEFIRQEDGTVLAIDKTTAQSLGTVVTPQDAASAAQRAAQNKAATTLPTDLASLDASTGKIDETIEKIKETMPLVTPGNVGIESYLRGDLPGFLGGEPRTLKKAVKSLQANFGFDTLNQMRAASKSGGALGQVSERELDLLVNALRAIDLEGDVKVLRDNFNAVITHYENYKSEIEKMKQAMMEQAGQPTEQPKVIDFNDLPQG